MPVGEIPAQDLMSVLCHATLRLPFVTACRISKSHDAPRQMTIRYLRSLVLRRLSISPAYADPVFPRRSPPLRSSGRLVSVPMPRRMVKPRSKRSTRKNAVSQEGRWPWFFLLGAMSDRRSTRRRLEKLGRSCGLWKRVIRGLHCRSHPLLQSPVLSSVLNNIP